MALLTEEGKPVAELQPESLQDIQGIVISGYGHLPCASYLLLRVTDAAGARRWLAHLVDEITVSERKQEGTSLNLALTHDGLAHLGLAAEALATFPRPFLEGMATPHRSRILGDADENAPANWNWGGDNESKAVDILRSEEHTSELQSRLHLVCRLLLEKKKNRSHQLHLQTRVPALALWSRARISRSVQARARDHDVPIAG